MVLLAAFVWVGPAAGATPETFLALLNRARGEAEREPLSAHPVLERVAAERARHLAEAGRLERPDLDALMERLDDRGLPVRSLEEASLVTSGPAVPAHEVLDAWQRYAGDSFERFLSADVTDLGVAWATRDGRTVYTFLGALPEARRFARILVSLGDPDDLRRGLLEPINEARRRAGVPPLEPDRRLTEAAQARADDMAARQYYGHETPEGVDFGANVDRAGYSYSAVAENIARGQESVDEVVDGWLASPGHRANLLNSAFTDVGFGFAAGRPGSEYTFLWVQILGRPAPPVAEPE